MYRKYLTITLAQQPLKKKNQYAPEGIKFCNGLCQDFLSIDAFSQPIQMICSDCSNSINMAKKMIKNKKITLDEFKSNPLIVHGTTETIVSVKRCKTCKEMKKLTMFPANRRICKACKAIQTLERNSNIDGYITDINTLKDKGDKLKLFVERIAKDRLIRIISHFGVGRKSTDSKAQMVNNVVAHFNLLQNPFLCRGGCGHKLQEQLGTCGGCTKTKAKTKRSLQVFIDEVLPGIIADLQIFDNDNLYLYNKAEFVEIAKAVGIKTKQSQKKANVIQLINDHIKKVGKGVGVEVETTIETPLELNSVMIETRGTDGFVNATQLCKAGGKLFANWYQLLGTKKLIEEFESDPNIPISQYNVKSVQITKGNSSKFKQGSWIHPDLAIQLAQWISPRFALKVSRWVRELALTGSVTVGQEKTNNQLLMLQTQLLKEKTERKAIENKHRNILHKRSYHKFKKGNALYVISDPESDTKKFKIGIDEVDINVRLAQHRTTLPALKLEFLMYTRNSGFIEKAMLDRYMESRKPFMNHEWIYNIECKHIIDGIITMCDFLCYDYTVEENLEIYNTKV